MHSLLAEQLRRHLGGIEIEGDWERLIDQVDEVYKQADLDFAVQEQRIRHLECLNDVGRQIDQRVPVPELLQWVVERLPFAMSRTELCSMLITLDGHMIGDAAVLDLACLISADIQVDQGVVGSLYAGCVQDCTFVDQEEALLTALARKLGAYIEAQRLLFSAQDQAAHEQMIREITSHIRSVNDPDDILRTAVKELGLALHRSTFVRAAGQALDSSGSGVGRLREESLRARLSEKGFLFNAGQIWPAGSFWLPAIEQAVKQNIVISASPDSPVMLAPLTGSGEGMYGVLGVRQDPEFPLSKNEQALVLAVAEQAAQSLGRAELFVRTRQALDEAEAIHRRYLQETWDAYLSDSGRGSQGYVADAEGAVPLSRVESVSSENDVTHTDDPDHSSGITLAVPLRSPDGQTVGVIDLYREHMDQPWSAEEIEVIQSMGTQIAEGIVSEQLFEQTQVSLAEARRMYEAGRRISEASDERGVLQVLLDVVAITGADRVEVLMFDHPSSSQMPASQRMSAFWDRLRREPFIPLGESQQTDQYPLVGLVSRQDVVVSDDAWLDARIDESAHALLQEIVARVVATIPIVAGSEWLGYVTIIAGPSHTFTPEELRLYQAVSGQAAIALRSLRLLRAAEQRARRERIIREITTKISDTVELDSMLNTTVQELGRALGVSRAFVRLSTGSDEDGSDSSFKESEDADGGI